MPERSASTVFSILTRADIARLVQAVTRRVVYCAPGLTQDVAASLVAVAARLPHPIAVILDATAQSARVGYGEFDGVTLLHEHGIAVRIQSGLRIGFVEEYQATPVVQPRRPLAAN